MSDKCLLDIEDVIRALFAPSMLDNNGMVSLAAFKLRHNEDYFSVARMSVDGWMDDIKRIPQNPQRQLYGYCKMNVGGIRKLGFKHDENNEIGFDVQDKSSESNKSHAGITILFGENILKGDKAEVLKPIPHGVSAIGLLMRIQTKLVQLANENIVKLQEPLAEDKQGKA